MTFIEESNLQLPRSQRQVNSVLLGALAQQSQPITNDLSAAVIWSRSLSLIDGDLHPLDGHVMVCVYEQTAQTSVASDRISPECGLCEIISFFIVV